MQSKYVCALCKASYGVAQWKSHNFPSVMKLKTTPVSEEGHTRSVVLLLRNSQVTHVGYSTTQSSTDA